MSDGADEIPPYSSSSMNIASDIAQLSYKELQALALRYRVPGNVKKKVLVKVLQAARSGNEMEFSRLLQELRKNRKRKARKSKDSKLGITSTPLHSPDYIMTDDDYYCQQQQQQQQPQAPYQWIGAEEEIVSKDDDKFPHYEEFKQFLLKRIQREFQACDNNNNQMQDLHLDTIVDLQSAPISPNLQMIPLDGPNYLKSNLINDADPLAISSVDRSGYQVLKEPEGSSQGSFLLKRMLQAPVGANLGEIASSLFWASNLLDNSDTLTAESESNENEDRELDEELALEEHFADTNANDYCLLKNNKGEYLLNDANLMSQQVPSMLPADDQYRFPNEVNNRPNNSYQNWTITSVTEVPNGDLQSPKIFHAIYYNNTDPTMTAANNNMTYQYQNDTACNGGQNFFNFDAQDTNSYATGTDMMTTNNSNDIYYLQNFGKHNGEMGTEYFRNADTFGQSSAQQNVYANDQQYPYFYPRPEEAIDPINERLEQQQNNVMAEVQNDVVNQETVTENLHRPINGTMEPFWPKWTAQANNNLENILNYHISKQVDYSKLNMTSCVYCYEAPIVMHQPSHGSIPTDSGCWHERRYTAEQRQHSFLPYWMLYDDTSQGMRMTNMPSDPTMPTHTTTIPSNDNLKEIVHDTSIAPINDVWMNEYEPVSIADEMNIHVSDPLFCNVTVDRIDDIPDTSDIAKT